ncbi:IS200/IS605 family transposase [Brevifollis gellanilyticus]|nr:IS200/IS605 family transposase [Brevifollis gellanilyticus]
MPQSLSLVIVHLVFSTKDRIPFVLKEMRPRLHAYMAEVARSHGCMAYRVGGVADHVHLALTLPRTMTQSDLVKELKTASNHWLEKQDRKSYADFAWQRGYGMFSIGKSQLTDLVQYIEDQEAHHAKRTFQEEFRALLSKYGMEYDEAYVWD